MQQRRIDIVGLGAGNMDQLPLGVYKDLKNEYNTIYIRTKDHPVVKELEQEGVVFQAFDAIYESKDTFEEVYEAIVAQLLRAASQKERIVYAVPGHPLMAEKTVQMLRDSPDVTINITGGQSFLDDLFTTLGIDPIDGFQLLDATDFNRDDLKLGQPLVFAQVYDRFVASNVKLTLLDDLPPDYPVTIVEAAGTKEMKVITRALSELDHANEFNNLTSVYVPPVAADLLNHTFSRLKNVIARLRSPEGCPWDKAQTHESLRVYAIEEVYELIEAIDQGDDEGIVEELGDVLLQVMLHSQIGKDNDHFCVNDVIQTLTDKMIRRHPHVFSDVQADTPGDVQQNWEQIKQREKGEKRHSLLDDIPEGLPALVRARKLQDKTVTVGFDQESVSQIWARIDEKRAKLENTAVAKETGELEKDIGDILFNLVKIVRYYNICPELALNRMNQTFINRFGNIEAWLWSQHKTFKDITQEEMAQYWNEIKEGEKE